MERIFADDSGLWMSAGLTIPTQAIYGICISIHKGVDRSRGRTDRPFWPDAFDNNADGVREANRVVRSVRLIRVQRERRFTEGELHTREKEHLAFFDANIAELFAIYDPQEHATLVLIEPFLHLELDCLIRRSLACVLTSVSLT